MAMPGAGMAGITPSPVRLMALVGDGYDVRY